MDDPWATIREAAADKTRGAASIARSVALAIQSLSPNERRRAVETVLRAHPSMAPLWRLASGIAHREPDPTGPLVWWTVISGMLVPPEWRFRCVADVLPERVVTISYSSSVADAIRLRRPRGVICLRSEPGGEGERMAELISDWTQPEVVDDDGALRRVPGEAVVTGADAVTPSGVVNKVKTRALVEGAGREGIPCYAVANLSKYVGNEMPIVGPFESTKLELFTGIANGRELLSPEEARSQTRLWPLHPSLIPLLKELGGTE